jgi:hypothetical protein
LLPWRESCAEVIVIREDENGQIDCEELERYLEVLFIIHSSLLLNLLLSLNLLLLLLSLNLLLYLYYFIIF